MLPPQQHETLETMDLQSMAQNLMGHPDNMDLAEQYYAAALKEGKIQSAENTFENILGASPSHHPMRRLLIASCLVQHKYEKAMADIELLTAFTQPDDGLIDSALQVRQKIGPKVFPSGAIHNSTLALCMVVKNEVRFLAPCLNAVKSVVDEIIIVDTGSTDRTVDLARIFGARVYPYQWQEDFSAARNYSLEKAEGNWILVIDADEIIAPKDLAILKKTISDHLEHPTAFVLETRNYTSLTNTVQLQPNTGEYALFETGVGWIPSRKIRLFPNLPEIRFQYPVHELVDASVRSAGIPIKDSDVPVHHYGQLNEKRNRQKAENYFKMGYAKLDALGDDVAALRELAVQAGQLAYWAESLELWRRLLKLRPDYVEAFVNMSGVCWQMGDYNEALALSRDALALNPDATEAQYNAAVSLLLLGRGKEAVPILEALCKSAPRNMGAKFMLASSLVCSGDIQSGLNRLRQLEKDTSPMTPGVALQDLISRFGPSPHKQYVERLEQVMNHLQSKD